MNRQEVIQYEHCSVQVNYRTKVGPQSRTGILYAAGMGSVVFWPFESEDEVIIKYVDIDDVWLI